MGKPPAIVAGHAARVTIGLPVYNGEPYLAQTIESVLAQTHGDFRLLIADNASTDGTGEIARSFVKRDDRVEYHRHERNIGWVRNHNFLVERNEDPFFKWCAHDDPIAPDFLKECLRVLEGRPECAAGFCHTLAIDGDGQTTGTLDRDALRPGLRPSDRVRWAMWTPYVNEIFAVVRSRAIRACAPMSSYVATDHVFVADLYLQGDIALAEGYHCYRRFHEGAYTAYWWKTDRYTRLASLDPDSRWPAWTMPTRRLTAYLDVFRRAPISLTEKAACVAALTERSAKRWWARRRSVVRPGRIAEILGVPPGVPAPMPAHAETADRVNGRPSPEAYSLAATPEPRAAAEPADERGRVAPREA